MYKAQIIHPLWIRITHGINALTVVLMVMSGWKIYNASPIFHFNFPEEITLGGWLGGALLWHFFAMWILMANGLIYLGLNLATNRFKRKLSPISLPALLLDMLSAIKGKLAHTDCKDADRRGDFAETSFNFLGFTFRPRLSKNRWGKTFVNSSPAVSAKAAKAIRHEIRSWDLQNRSDKALYDLAHMFNAKIRGWVNYY